MANATSTIEEVRFDLRDEQITHVYVLSRGSWDAPIGVQGWHYKAFPARIPMVEILTPQHIGDYLLWPLKAPEQHDSYMTINADGALSPETENALAHMGQLVAEQYAEQDKGSAIEEGVDLTELALKEVTAAFARLQSEHSDLIERERLLEAELAAIPWDAIEKMQGCEAHTYDTELAKIQVHNWARGHRPRTPNIVP